MSDISGRARKADEKETREKLFDARKQRGFFSFLFQSKRLLDYEVPDSFVIEFELRRVIYD